MDLNDKVSPTFEKHGLTWHKLGVRDRCQILRRLKERKRVQHEANLRTSKVEDPATLFAELDNFDRSEFGQVEFIDYVNTLDGQDEVQSIALHKAFARAAPALKTEELDAKVSAAMDELVIGQCEANTLTAKLCGLEIVRKGDAGAAGGEGTDPNAPAGEPAAPKLQGYGS